MGWVNLYTINKRNATRNFALMFYSNLIQTEHVSANNVQASWLITSHKYWIFQCDPEIKLVSVLENIITKKKKIEKHSKLSVILEEWVSEYKTINHYYYKKVLICSHSTFHEAVFDWKMHDYTWASSIYLPDLASCDFYLFLK